jgi:hypothetical protein
MTASAALAGSPPVAPPRLRRIPAPVTDPPYDDELGPDHWDRWARPPQADETLALAFVLPSGVPAVPAVPPQLRIVRRDQTEEEDEDRDFAPQPTTRSELPDPREWAGRLVQAIVEVIAGLRPPAQLVRWTSAQVYDGVAARAHTRRRGEPRARLTSVHVCEPADGIAEVSAVVQRGARSRAVALRIEGLDGRWQCTAFAEC